MQGLCGFCQEAVSPSSCQYVDSKVAHNIVLWAQAINKDVSSNVQENMSLQWCQMCYGLATNVLRSLTHLGERLTNRGYGKNHIKEEHAEQYGCGISVMDNPGKSTSAASASPHPAVSPPPQHSIGGDQSMPALINQIRSLNQAGHLSGNMQYHPHSMMGSSANHPAQTSTAFSQFYHGLPPPHQRPTAQQGMPFSYMFMNSQPPEVSVSQAAFVPTGDAQREQFINVQRNESTQTQMSQENLKSPSNSAQSKHPSSTTTIKKASKSLANDDPPKDSSPPEEGLTTASKNGSLLDTDLHKCYVCRKVFTERKWLQAHMSRHRLGNEFVCSECNKTFTDRRNFRRHCRLHSDDTPYKCEVCGKKCGRNKDLKNHMKSHEPERSFHCIICGKSFKHQQGYNHHMAVHSNQAFSTTSLQHEVRNQFHMEQMTKMEVEKEATNNIVMATSAAEENIFSSINEGISVPNLSNMVNVSSVIPNLNTIVNSASLSINHSESHISMNVDNGVVQNGASSVVRNSSNPLSESRSKNEQDSAISEQVVVNDKREGTVCTTTSSIS